MAYQEGVPVAVCGGGEKDRLWEDLVATHGSHVERCVATTMRGYGWSPRREEVEDLAQEVWLHLFRRRPKSPNEWRSWSASRLRCYLGAMARNAVVDELRKRCAAKRGGGAAASGLEEVELEREELDSRRACEETPEERLLEAERGGELMRRLALLLGGSRPGRDASILVLSVVEEHTSYEIAELLGGSMAAGSVYSVLHRARATLAEHGIEAVEGALGRPHPFLRGAHV